MSDFRYVVRKWVKPEDLNAYGALFGGRLLEWADEEGALVALSQIGTNGIVTRHISELDFVARADLGDLLELEFCVVAFGRTSITLSCGVTNAVTGAAILNIERIVYVAVDEAGQPMGHGQSEVTNGTERVRRQNF